MMLRMEEIHQVMTWTAVGHYDVSPLLKQQLMTTMMRLLCCSTNGVVSLPWFI